MFEAKIQIPVNIITLDASYFDELLSLKENETINGLVTLRSWCGSCPSMNFPSKFFNIKNKEFESLVLPSDISSNFSPRAGLVGVSESDKYKSNYCVLLLGPKGTKT